MKINSSQVMFSTEHEKNATERYNRQQSQAQTQTTRVTDAANNPPGTRVINVNEVDLSYQARMYSQQESELNSFSRVTQGNSEQTHQTQRATQSLVQTVIGVEANIFNLSLTQGTQALINPNASRAYDQVASLDITATDDGTQVNASNETSGLAVTQTQQARLEIKEQYSLVENERLQVGTQGRITTEDGREIDFMMHLDMERHFSLEQTLNIRSEERQLIDPLVINFDAAASSLTSTSFSFDLDADGSQEEISFTGQGSGFLALDSNNDGRINDGSELFGTGDLNGFSELAKYDNDDNKWIDENDEIFDKLKIWTRDENGQDQLLSLKEAGVGAIYLGSTSASFDLTDSENNLLGQVKQTGIFLTEQGEVASIQELDIAIHDDAATSTVDQSLANIESQVGDWNEQVDNNTPDWRDLTNQSLDLEIAEPVFNQDEDEEKLPTLLDRLFPKPGSEFDTKDREAGERSVQRQTSTTQTVSSQSTGSPPKVEEEDEQERVLVVDKKTIDVLDRLKNKQQHKLVEEQEQHAHLKAIIESLEKRHSENLQQKHSLEMTKGHL